MDLIPKKRTKLASLHCQNVSALLSATEGSTITLGGSVKFNFSDIPDPVLNAQIHLTGEYKQFKTVLSTKNVPTDEMKILIDNLYNWLNKHFPNLDKKTKYKVSEATIHFLNLMTPFWDTQSDEFGIFHEVVAIGYILDDYLERKPISISSGHDVSKLVKYICSLWSENPENDIILEESPILKTDEMLKNVFPIFRDHYKRCRKINSDSPELYEMLRKGIGAYFYAAMLWRDDCISKECPKGFFKAFRMHDGAARQCFFTIAILTGVRLPEGISNFPLFDKMIDGLAAATAMQNDILGSRKSLFENDVLGFGLVDIAIHKVPVQSAITKVCEQLNKRLDNAVYSMNSLIQHFNNDENLLAFFIIIICVINGNNYLYCNASRYMNNHHSGAANMGNEIIIENVSAYPKRRTSKRKRQF